MKSRMGMYNTWNLRNDASFEVKIAPGLFWVPVNTFGQSRYTMEEITCLTPATGNLSKLELNFYETIAFFQKSNFKEINNIKTAVDPQGDFWEMGVTADEAQSGKGGLCSFFASWLCGFLRNYYEDYGYIWIVRNNAIGHVINFFRFKEDFYVFDLNAMLSKYSGEIPVEDGKFTTYAKSKFICGALLKTPDLKNFVNYYKAYTRLAKAEFLYLAYLGDSSPTASCKIINEKVEIRMLLDPKYKIVLQDYNPQKYMLEYISSNLCFAYGGELNGR